MKIDLKFLVILIVMIGGFYLTINSNENGRYELHKEYPLVIDTKTGEIHKWQSEGNAKDGSKVGTIKGMKKGETIKL